MSINPYEAPTCEVRDGTPASPTRQHARPLWFGLIASVVAPAALVTVWFLLVDGGLDGRFSPYAAFVAAASIAIAGVPALILGLPVVLLLRRMKRLKAGYVLLASVPAGTLYGALLGGEILLGGGLGLVAGLGMVFGAGVPFLKHASTSPPETSSA